MEASPGQDPFVRNEEFEEDGKTYRRFIRHDGTAMTMLISKGYEPRREEVFNEETKTWEQKAA